MHKRAMPEGSYSGLDNIQQNKKSPFSTTKEKEADLTTNKMECSKRL
jgi:hypothetical protein